MSELGIICIVILATFFLLSLPVCIALYYMAQVLAKRLRQSGYAQDRERHDYTAMAERFVEMFENPDSSLERHSRERREQVAMDTSLLREEIKRGAKNETSPLFHSDDLEPVPKTMEEVDIR